ncbi:hypothetical protein [Rhodococcus sp. 11-3]|uniref:hypothetical protein n=1 Tax=Rhodococcus sp. 11-3 TaxID=2854796 RepID=UPI00203D7A51|nr:hypothetical protein [Rhodococcus sp. 11-3]USC17006.1 hypothetical protein KZJ41_09130 [Rhodococcus sp. 11-3]
MKIIVHQSDGTVDELCSIGRTQDRVELRLSTDDVSLPESRRIYNDDVELTIVTPKGRRLRLCVQRGNDFHIYYRHSASLKAVLSD